jgi:hypothetical protein
VYLMYLIECCNTNILHCPIRMKYCVACVCPMQYIRFLHVCSSVELLLNSYASEQQRSWWSTEVASELLAHVLLRTKE